MDRIWGRPGAGAPLSQEEKDFTRKQKREQFCSCDFKKKVEPLKAFTIISAVKGFSWCPGVWVVSFPLRTPLLQGFNECLPVVTY